MFTGIVQTIGKVRKLEKLADSVRITVEGVPEGVAHGESVAVNGVCLTAVGDTAHGTFVADVMNETLKRTNVGDLKPGDDVNLERAATLSTFLGGHLVQGHVDAVGVIASREPGEKWEVVRFKAPKEVVDHLVEKGSIAINGVSLTVVDVDADSFTVSLIPTTLKDTNLGTLPVGAKINLEIDMFSKHIAKYLAPYLEQVRA
ncbi:MAG: riboflavin synthase [Patescibacteria group bacterium]